MALPLSISNSRAVGFRSVRAELRSRRPIAIAFLALVASGCTAPWVYQREGATIDQRQAERRDCNQRAQREVGTGVGGFAGGVGEGIAIARATLRCMDEAGWQRVPLSTLSPEDRTALSATLRAGAAPSAGTPSNPAAAMPAAPSTPP